ncbi:hypothetical protein EVA25_01675 [bacterium]|nr:MAG: hypothetical protein EVA25_01675 [bacterium]
MFAFLIDRSDIRAGLVFLLICFGSARVDAQVMFRDVRFWDADLLSHVSLVRGDRYVSLTEDEHGGCELCRGLFGVGLGFGLHEGGHLLTNTLFQSDPYVKPVKGAGIPFFAISHRKVLPSWQEAVVASSGLWTQFALAETILTRAPDLRRQRAPIQKGLLAFHVGLSLLYGVAGLGHWGPPERDTRGIAQNLGVNERWVGAVVLAPGLLDAYRYYRAAPRWVRWGSRIAKLALAAPFLKKF